MLSVEIVTFFLAPVFQVVGYSLTEVFCLSVVVDRMLR